MKFVGPIAAPTTTPVTVYAMTKDDCTELWSVVNNGDEVAEFTWDGGTNWMSIPQNSCIGVRSVFLKSDAMFQVRATSSGGPVTGIYLYLGILFDMHTSPKTSPVSTLSSGQASLRGKLPTAGGMVVMLGGSFREIRFWVETGGYAHVSLNGPATAANVRVDDTMSALVLYASPPTDRIYIYTSTDMSAIYYDIIAR